MYVSQLSIKVSSFGIFWFWPEEMTWWVRPDMSQERLEFVPRTHTHTHTSWLQCQVPGTQHCAVKQRQLDPGSFLGNQSIQNDRLQVQLRDHVSKYRMESDREKDMMASASGLHTCPLTQVSARYTHRHIHRNYVFMDLWRKGVGKPKNWKS